MLLNNVYILGREKSLSQLEIKNSIISDIRSISECINKPKDKSINFSNALVFSGLINSHDHLEFNLYPKLGDKTYNDYTEWGSNIHNLHKDKIELVKRIPYKLRFKWGLYKNLICGVTTVVHHGKDNVINFDNLPYVLTEYNYLHSVRLEQRWKLKLNIIFNYRPFVIHICEGTNNKSALEASEFTNWNIFRKKLIGVHGISLSKGLSEKFKAIVWCPESNFFLYNKTADIPAIKEHTEILFGTDSALTSDWNIWNHLRTARELRYLDDAELYDSITETPSRIWGINSTGSIAKNKNADLVIVKSKGSDNFESFYSIEPEDILLIIKNGRILLIDEKLQKDQAVVNECDFDLIDIKSIRKFVTKGVINLIREIKYYLPDYNFPIQPVY